MQWLQTRPWWEARMRTEVLLTRSAEEAADNSRVRREHLWSWPGNFARGGGSIFRTAMQALRNPRRQRRKRQA